jgi:hypothetical protein
LSFGNLERSPFLFSNIGKSLSDSPKKQSFAQLITFGDAGVPTATELSENGLPGFGSLRPNCAFFEVITPGTCSGLVRYSRATE